MVYELVYAIHKFVQICAIPIAVAVHTRSVHCGTYPFARASHFFSPILYHYRTRVTMPCGNVSSSSRCFYLYTGLALTHGIFLVIFPRAYSIIPLVYPHRTAVQSTPAVWCLPSAAHARSPDASTTVWEVWATARTPPEAITGW